MQRYRPEPTFFPPDSWMRSRSRGIPRTFMGSAEWRKPASAGGGSLYINESHQRRQRHGYAEIMERDADTRMILNGKNDGRGGKQEYDCQVNHAHGRTH